jgi:structure-specific recognition protein 1
VRTSEGFLYLLDKYILFISKQPVLVAYNDVQVCRFERCVALGHCHGIAELGMHRVSGAVAAARTFDLRIEMRTEASDVTFSSIVKDEHQPISEFLSSKKLKVKNEIMEDMVGTQQAVVRGTSI